MITSQALGHVTAQHGHVAAELQITSPQGTRSRHSVQMSPGPHTTVALTISTLAYKINLKRYLILLRPLQTASQTCLLSSSSSLETSIANRCSRSSCQIKRIRPPNQIILSSSNQMHSAAIPVHFVPQQAVAAVDPGTSVPRPYPSTARYEQCMLFNMNFAPTNSRHKAR